MTKSREPSQRQLRVGELIRHELAGIFLRNQVNDPAIEAAGVTVVEVRTSPDLKVATAYIRSLMNCDADMLVSALNRHSRYIRGLLSPRLKLKFMPELRFHHDTAQDHASRIDALLNLPEVRRDLGRTDGGEE